VTLTIRKGLPLSSGLGGSAASAVAAVVAVDGLLGARTPLERLMACAFEGSASAPAPRTATICAAIYGGFVLVRCRIRRTSCGCRCGGADGGRRASGSRD